MSVELFFKLREIDSLTKMRTKYISDKAGEEERLIKLAQRQEDTNVQTTILRKKALALQDELAELEKKLATASEQKQRVLDIGGDEKKIALFNLEINICEEKGLEILGQQEELDQELADNKTFLAGIEKTIQEIRDEVSPAILKLDQEIANIDLRLKLLQDELPENFRNLLIKTTAKKLAHGPFTRNEQGSCYFCRYKISKLDESEIDMQLVLKTCSQCGRIFLPYGS